jgi:hypothetical protein
MCLCVTSLYKLVVFKQLKSVLKIGLNEGKICNTVECFKGDRRRGDKGKKGIKKCKKVMKGQDKIQMLSH